MSMDMSVNMSAKLLLLLCVFGVIASSCGEKEEKYETKYDNINVDAILGNKRVLSNYIKCILDEGPCTAEGREFRSKYISFNMIKIKFKIGLNRVFCYSICIHGCYRMTLIMMGIILFITEYDHPRRNKQWRIH